MGPLDMERLSVPLSPRAMPGNILGYKDIDKPGTFSVVFLSWLASGIAGHSSRTVAVVFKIAHLDGLVLGGYDYSRFFNFPESNV